METEHNQVLHELRAEIVQLEKEFARRLRGLQVLISVELGEIKPGPESTTFVSSYLPRKKKVRCGRL